MTYAKRPIGYTKVMQSSPGNPYPWKACVKLSNGDWSYVFAKTRLEAVELLALRRRSFGFFLCGFDERKAEVLQEKENRFASAEQARIKRATEA